MEKNDTRGKDVAAFIVALVLLQTDDLRGDKSRGAASVVDVGF